MLSSALLALLPFAAAVHAGKRGLCWPWFNGILNPGLFNTGSDEVVAIYDYETYAPPSTNGSGGLDFIGMQRCLDCSSSPIDELYSRSQEQEWDIVFTLNEPDINGIGPSAAASWYINHINPLPIKKALPSVTSSTQSSEGLSWLSQMISACDCQCDFVYLNLHWYGDSFTEFQNYIVSAHEQFPDYQFVITEFALQNPPGGQSYQVAFFEEAFSFLDSTPYVELYFPFVATSLSLLEENDSSAASSVGSACLYNNDGSLSPVGELMLSTEY